jgi:hypothetical protein
MDEVWRALIQSAPWGVVIIALRWLEIKAAADERKERDSNAKEKSIADRETQIIVGKAYADAINNLAAVVLDFKGTVMEQYENMGITQDLVRIARARFQGDKTKRSGD